MKNKLFLFIILIFLIGCTSKEITLDSFAQCLTEKGAVMYGAEWCSHCQNQKKLFGDAFQHIKYVDCEANKDECLSAGVRAFPTWIINEETHVGGKPFDVLASLTKCEAP